MKCMPHCVNNLLQSNLFHMCMFHSLGCSAPSHTHTHTHITAPQAIETLATGCRWNKRYIKQNRQSRANILYHGTVADHVSRLHCSYANIAAAQLREFHSPKQARAPPQEASQLFLSPCEMFHSFQQLREFHSPKQARAPTQEASRLFLSPCEVFHSKLAHSHSKLNIYFPTHKQSRIKLCTQLHDVNLTKLTIKYLKGTVW